MKPIEELQNCLYQAAKADKGRRFYSLHDKIYRMDVLREAWRRVKENYGAAGVDRETIEDIERDGVEQFLSELQRQLQTETYRVQCVRRVYIPKRNGGMRPLGIPTVKDRVVQQAVRLIIEPIFEADFQEFSYGYRPKRSAKQASLEIRKWLNYGLTSIIDVDIDGFFDHINHNKLLSFVMEKITDGYVISLIKEWLGAGVLYLNSMIYPEEGTCQGGVISPLSANIYLNKLDGWWSELGLNRRDTYNAQMVRYADDIVILTDSKETKHIREVFEFLLSELDLKLNIEKSRETDARKGFDFLSFHYVRRQRDRYGKMVTIFFPSLEAGRRFKHRVGEMASRKVAHLKDERTLVRELNRFIVGWTSYFNHSNASETYNHLQSFVEWKFAKFMCFRHHYTKLSFRHGGFLTCYRYGLVKLTGRISQAKLPIAVR
jgi:group II intron reverse transcriptase/maturase